MTKQQPRNTTGWILVVTLLSVAIVAAAALGAWQYVVKSAKPPPPVANSAAARDEVIDATKANLVKLWNYRSDTFDQDIATAQAVQTGQAREDYKKSMDNLREIIIQSAAQSTARPSGIAVESMNSERASILVFANITQTSKDRPTPAESAVSFRFGMVKQNGTWLIEKFDPL